MMNLDGNFDEIAKRLMAKVESKKEEIDEALLDAAQRIQNLAVLDAPVDTGNLRKSIKLKRIEGGYETYVDLDQAPYGFWVEYGTRFQAPQRFFQPAIEYVQPFLYQNIKDILRTL